MGIDLFDPPTDGFIEKPRKQSDQVQSSRVYSVWRYYDKDDKLLYVTQNPNQQVIYTSEWWRDVDYIKVKHFPDRAQQISAKFIAVDTENPAHNIHGRGL